VALSPQRTQTFSPATRDGKGDPWGETAGFHPRMSTLAAVLTLARWSTVHRRLVAAGWVVVLAVAVAVWLGFGSRYSNDFHLPNTGSERARNLLRSGFPRQAGDRDQIVLHARGGTLATPAVRRRVQAMLGEVARLPYVASVTSPYAPAARAISRDGTIGFATVVLERTPTGVGDRVTRRVISTAEAARSPELQVELGGPAIENAQRTAIGSSMIIGLGAAMVVLLLSFGSLLAMGLPIVTALGGLGTGMGIVALFSRVIAMPDFSGELALMIGLGVGVDYALFIVTRYREAYRTNGGDVSRAVAVAADTAGRAVVFAGATVVISLMGMCALGVGFLYGPAVASSVAVLLVLLASLTLLPALLAAAGHRIGRVGRLGRRRTEPREGRGAWEWWIRRIQRRPWIAAAAATGLLLALASPALDLRLGNTDAGNDPTSQTTRRGYDLLARGFGKGFNGPLLLVAKLPRPGDAAALDQLAAALRRTPDVAAVTPPLVSRSGEVATVSAFPRSSPQSGETESLVARLRADVIPPLARATGATIYVGGFTASQIDFAHLIASKLWIFIAAVIVLSALLLLVVFRSLLIPLQAAVMNLLSIGASLGVVVAVFQLGWLGSLFGISGGPIQAFLPVMVFAIVFGLSMDYEVFLVSRIHEAWVHGSSASESVRLGLTRTGRVVTAAAAVMVVVFASFMFAGDRTIALFGLGLSSAVLLDAVVIRCVLLPAVLELLGRSTWWFPRRLDRVLPRLAIEPPEEPELPVAVSEEPEQRLAGVR
jgi:RND superfamily putative drug exporter